jgi:hypothetical protein
MSRLVHIDQIDSFREVANTPPAEVTDNLREAVKALHEIDDMEDLIRLILSDRAATPHGPAEIVDILTHKVLLGGSPALAAFVLKGRSYPTVRPKDIAHQIYRLEKIEGMRLAVRRQSLQQCTELTPFIDHHENFPKMECLYPQSSTSLKT